MFKQKRATKKLRKWTIGVVAVTMLIGQSVASAAGVVSTTYGRSVAQDGDVNYATFRNPSNTITDSQTGIMYIADTGNNKIRQFDPNSQTVSTLAGRGIAGYQDGAGNEAEFDQPTGIALDEANGILYVSELGNSAIRAIDVTSGDVKTIAGQGVGVDDNGNTVSLDQPYNLLFNPSDNLLYIADTYNHQIKTYSSIDRIITVLAGNGAATALDSTLLASSFIYPTDIAIDSNTGEIFVADIGSHTIRVLNPRINSVKTFAGTGLAGFSNGTAGNLKSASFNQPRSLSLDTEGNLYVADLGNHVIREIDRTTNELLTIAGTDLTSGIAYGQPQTAKLSFPSGVRFNESTGKIDITSYGSNLIADFNPTVRRASNNTQLPDLNFVVGQSTRSGLQDGAFYTSLFNMPYQLTKDENGNVYVADSGNHAIRKINSSGMVTTIAGNGSIGNQDGIGTQATFNSPQGIAYDSIGNRLFVADSGNHVIRMIDLSTFGVTTVAGTGAFGYLDGTGSMATFGSPLSLAFDGDAHIYISDSSNFVIRRMSLNVGDNYLVETYAGSNVSGYQDGNLAQAQFQAIGAIAIDTNNQILYIADSGSEYIRKIDLSRGDIVETIAGSGRVGQDDGEGNRATFGSMFAMTYGSDNKLYLTDDLPGKIRSVDLNPDEQGNLTYFVTTLTNTQSSGYVDSEAKYVQFGNKMHGIVQLDNGNLLISDTRNHTLRTFDFPPVISGVIDGNIYMEPAIVTPTFTEGTATLTRNGITDPFVSGTDVYLPGNYVLEVTDAVGNVVSVSFSIQSVSNTPVLTSGVFSNQSTPTFSGYADSGDIVYVLISEPINNTLIASGTAVADANGNWLYQVDSSQALSDGQYDVQVYARDVNFARSLDAFSTITIDTAAPDAPIVTNIVGQNTSSPTLSGTVSERDLILHWTMNGGSGSRLLTGTTWTIPFMSLPEGAFTATIWVEDSAGNASPSVLQSLVVDRTPPSVSVHASDLLQNMDPPTFTGTTEPNATVTLSLAGTFFPSVQADANGNWTLTLPNNKVPEGSHSLAVSAVDAVGWASGVVNYTFMFDSIPPATPVITSSALQAMFTPTITGTAEANSTIQVHVLGFTYTTQADATGNWRVQVPNGDLSSDGTYVVTVTAADMATNVSGVATFVLTLDTTSPYVPMLTSSLTQNQALPTFTGFADPGSVLTLMLNGKNYTTTAALSGAWTIRIPGGDELIDGTYAITMRSVDAAGNTSSDYTGLLEIDTVAPSQPIVNSGAVFTSATPSFMGTGEPGSTIVLVVNGNSYSIPVLSDGTWSLVIPMNQAIPDGQYTVKMTAVDAAGNGSMNVTQTITIDTSAPNVAVVTSPLGQASSTPTISGTAEANSTLFLQLNGVTYTVNVDARGNWTFTVPSGSALTDGTYSISITVSDSAGLQSQVLTEQLVIDATAPTTPIVTSSASQVTLTPTFEGQAEAGSTVFVEIDGQILSVIADSNGAWSIPVVRPLIAGSYTATVYAVDAMGNRSTVLTQLIAVRTANVLASLGGLTLSAGKLTPLFDRNVFKYKAVVKNGTKSIMIKPGQLPAGATVRVNGVLVTPGDSIAVPLISGISNKIGIEVTAEDGLTKVMYTLSVYRTAIKAYTQGYSGKNFRPDALIKREEMAFMLDKLFTKGKGSKGTGNYTDIGQMYWAKNEIVHVAKKGVMLGYNNGKFGFGKKLTRQQLATIIDRVVGLKKGSKLTFKDTIGMQDSKIMAAAVEAGYLKGYKDGTFRPNEGVTRAEAVILMNKLSNREMLVDRYAPQWNDVPTSHYAYAAIQNASIGR